jgi:hypothetical protein
VDSVHAVARDQHWLDPLVQISDDTILAIFFTAPHKAPQNVSSVEPFVSFRQACMNFIFIHGIA